MSTILHSVIKVLSIWERGIMEVHDLCGTFNGLPCDYCPIGELLIEPANGSELMFSVPKSPSRWCVLKLCPLLRCCHVDFPPNQARIVNFQGVRLICPTQGKLIITIYLFWASHVNNSWWRRSMEGRIRQSTPRPTSYRLPNLKSWQRSDARLWSSMVLPTLTQQQRILVLASDRWHCHWSFDSDPWPYDYFAPRGSRLVDPTYRVGCRQKKTDLRIIWGLNHPTWPIVFASASNMIEFGFT